MEIPIVYLKDKQMFRKEKGVLRFIGNAVEVARKMKKDGVKLIHIIDQNLEKGGTTNLDIYNHLTYFINIQVELTDQKIIEKLLNIRVRIVLDLPTKLPLDKWETRLLVGRVSNEKTEVDKVYDLILDQEELIESFKGKRIIFNGKTKKKVFGVLY
ncbi:MAG TPA: hypothetical protein VI912_05750 [Candidatus Bilamarchaeaceae archaeon]|nr:hypothetical protein [Candidatus Bilamarchaeaceae archaeon]